MDPGTIHAQNTKQSATKCLPRDLLTATFYRATQYTYQGRRKIEKPGCEEQKPGKTNKWEIDGRLSSNR